MLMAKKFYMHWLRNRLPVLALVVLAVTYAPGLVGGCASVPDERGWIKVGQTTSKEVVERYGQPDFVTVAEDGEIVVYRAIDPRQAPPIVEIPTAQAGPLGIATTKMEPVRRGTAAEGPMRELRIRYDARGVVQEVSP